MAGMFAEDEAADEAVTAPAVPNTAETGDASGQVSTMRRETPELPPERKALVKRRLAEAKRAEARWRKDFTRMNENIRFARGVGQWTGGSVDAYIANIAQRHVQQRTAALYAKNPKFTVKRRETMDFFVWDENPASLQAATMLIAPPPPAAPPRQGHNGGPPMDDASAEAGAQNAAPPAAPPPPPDPRQMQAAAMLIADVEAGMQRRRLMDNVARTTQIVLNQQLQAQQPPFKISMKAAVRRAITTSIAWVKIDFQREMGHPQPTVRAIADAKRTLEHLEAKIKDVEDGQVDEGAAEREEIRLKIQALQNEPEVPIREGIVYEFLPSDAIMVDPKCKDIRRLTGAEYLVEKLCLTIDRIKELYDCDLTGKIGAGRDSGDEKWRTWGQGGESGGDGEQYRSTDKGDKPVNVYLVHNRRDGLVYAVAEGYEDFLCEPMEPNVKLTRFWQYIPLCFNELEAEDKSTIYPPSDIDLLKPMQREYNRARQGLREHRQANRPAWVTPTDALEEEDKENLRTHPLGAVIELNALGAEDDIKKKIQALPTTPVDPGLYDVAPIFQDIERVIGSQAAALGGLSDDATATEVSVSEGARMSSIGSNIDDLDDFLSELARASGEIAFANFSLATVQKIAGKGAAWPQATRQEIAEGLMVDFEAGSSGRPNKAQEVQNFTALAPMLMQIPGITAEWMARQAVRVYDDRIDPTDAIVAGMPSIQAQNGLAAPSTGVPGTDPNAQGPAGGANAAQAPGQNAMPGPQQPDQVDPAGGLPARPAASPGLPGL
jgi:hypothetical protein